MNKLKQIGLSALAGTLVSMSAQAGGVSVNGTMELSYTKLDTTKVTGNPFGQKKNITFSGGGEFANGWTYGIMHAQTDAMDGLSSSSMNINMGGIMTIAYDSGTGGYGANAVDNIVPTAWEEVDYGFTTGITDLGEVSKTKGVVNVTLKAPGSGTALSLSYASRMGGSHTADGGTDTNSNTAGHNGVDAVIDILNIDSQWIGWRLGGAAQYINHPENCSDHQENLRAGVVYPGCSTQYEDAFGGTLYNSMRVGPLSAGFQATFKDPGSGADADVAWNEAWVAGAAFTVGNYLSVSYGQGFDEYKWNTKPSGEGCRSTPGSYLARSSANCLERVHAKFHGWSAAMNWGPIALKAVRNHVQNEGGTGKNGQTHSEVNLSMAF